MKYLFSLFIYFLPILLMAQANSNTVFSSNNGGGAEASLYEVGTSTPVANNIQDGWRTGSITIGGNVAATANSKLLLYSSIGESLYLRYTIPGHSWQAGIISSSGNYGVRDVINNTIPLFIDSNAPTTSMRIRSTGAWTGKRYEVETSTTAPTNIATWITTGGGGEIQRVAIDKVRAQDLDWSSVIEAADDPGAGVLGVPIDGLYQTPSGEVRIRKF